MKTSLTVLFRQNCHYCMSKKVPHYSALHQMSPSNCTIKYLNEMQYNVTQRMILYSLIKKCNYKVAFVVSTVKNNMLIFKIYFVAMSIGAVIISGVFTTNSLKQYNYTYINLQSMNSLYFILFLKLNFVYLIYFISLKLQSLHVFNTDFD